MILFSPIFASRLISRFDRPLAFDAFADTPLFSLFRPPLFSRLPNFRPSPLDHVSDIFAIIAATPCRSYGHSPRAPLEIFRRRRHFRLILIRPYAACSFSPAISLLRYALRLSRHLSPLAAMPLFQIFHCCQLRPPIAYTFSRSLKPMPAANHAVPC